MHRLYRQLEILRFSVLCIGIFFGLLSHAGEEPDPEDLAEKKIVYVEPSNISTTAVNGEYLLIPYRDRRPRWGSTASIGFSNYEPTHYDPNFTSATYGQTYSQPTVPLLELQVTVKRNLSFGSVGGEIAIGQYQNGHSDPNVTHSTLSLTPWRIGAVYAFDNYSGEPYVVPYVSGGLYSMIYKEVLNDSANGGATGNSLNGSSQVAPYFNFGGMFTLDWIDRRAARGAYKDSGIESSYLFLEGRTYVKSSNARDHDFSNPLSLGGGVRVEF